MERDSTLKGLRFDAVSLVKVKSYTPRRISPPLAARDDAEQWASNAKQGIALKIKETRSQYADND